MLHTPIRRILIVSGLTIATSFITVLSASANTATGSAGFSATVAAAVAVTTPFTGASSYDVTTYTASGGNSKLEKSDTIVFNSNTDTLGVTATVTATPPTAPANATALVGVHSTLISSNVGSETITATATARDFVTDSQGNLTLTVRSTWATQNAGEELFRGAYAATVALSVVAN